MLGQALEANVLSPCLSAGLIGEAPLTAEKEHTKVQKAKFCRTPIGLTV